MMNLSTWQTAILERGDLYRVGGAVRDRLMGFEEPVIDTDYLVAGISPDDLEALLVNYGRIQLVGRSFGVYKFTPAGAAEAIDIAFPRKEVSTGPGHKDFDVECDWTLPVEVDLGRRDFTMNAMAEHVSDGRVIDPYGGHDDIAARIVRMVFPETFREDPLRILRGVRFACRFDFDIETDTEQAMTACAGGVADLSAERIQEEMTRLLAQCDTPSRGLILFHHLGVLSRFFPELADSFGVTQNEYHPDDVFMHSVKSCDSAPQTNLAVRWAALLHDLGKVTKRMVVEGEDGESDRVVFYQHEEESARIAHHVLTRLRYSVAFVRKVESLVAHHMFLYQPEWRDATVRRFINRVGEDHVEDMFALRVADCMSRGMEEEVIKLEELRERVQEELETRHALSVKDLAIDGADLIRELHIKEGPDVGRILRELFDDVVENPDLNSREALLGLAKKRYR